MAGKGQWWAKHAPPKQSEWRVRQVWPWREGAVRTGCED